MKCAQTVPFLARLSKIDLAKLVPDMVGFRLEPGDTFEGVGKGLVHFVVEGQLELVTDTGVPLAYWGAGEIIQENELPDDQFDSWQIRALSAAETVSIPVDKFLHLIGSNPKAAQEYQKALSTRIADLIADLYRTRSMLADYAEELWRGIPDSAAVPVAAGISVNTTMTFDEPAQALVPARKTFPWAMLTAWSGTLVGGLTIIGGLQGSIDSARVTLGLLVAAAANWVAGRIPDFAVALGISVIAIMLNLAEPSLALAGFVSPTWFMLLAVWGIGVAVSKSGLLYRLALGMLKLLPPTYVGQSIAMALTGLITTPFLPSGQGRVVMVAPLVKELAEAMQFRRNSRGMAGLAMICLIGFGLMYFMFLNGSTLPLLAYSLLPDQVQTQVTWLFWLQAALPLGLFVFIASYLAIYRLLPPEQGPELSRETVSVQLRVLGPITWAEWVTGIVLVVTLASFAFAGFLHVQPTWIAMAGMLILIAAGTLDRDSLKRQVDWGFLLFFGAVLSFAGVARQNGVDEWLSYWIIPVFEYFRGSPWAFVGGVALITFLVRLVIPAVQAVPLLLIGLTPVAEAMGVSPFVVSLVVLTMGTNFVIPQQSPFYMALHAGTDQHFEHRQILRVAAAHACIMFVGLICSVPYWKWLGLLP